MEHIMDHRKSVMMGMLELLNDIGYNILHIDNTFYAFSSFVPADDTIFESTVRGRNITSKIENAIEKAQHQGGTAETALRQEIDAMSERMRVFHKDVPWKKYLGKGA